MKRLALLLALILILGIYPASSRADETAAPGASEPGGAEPAAAETSGTADEAADEATETLPAFTLSAQEDDSPEMLSLKAALRLLKHYQVTAKALQTCVTTPEAGEALKNFHRRNGNTLAPPVMEIIKNNGGLTPEIKAAMEMEVAVDTEALLTATDCRALTDLVVKSARDLYKAPELAEDYKRVKDDYERMKKKP